MKVKITHKMVDKGFKAATRRVANLDGWVVEIGFFGPRAQMRYRSKSGKIGPSVAEVAAFNEFGTANSPPRPFMRRTAFKYRYQNSVDMAKIASDYIDGRANTPKAHLERFGELYKKRVREVILEARTWAPPNSTITIRQKGANTPLLHTQAMIAAVSKRVRKKR